MRGFKQNAAWLDTGHSQLIAMDAADQTPKIFKKFPIVFQTEGERRNREPLTFLACLLGLCGLILFVVMGEVVTAPKEAKERWF